MTKFNSLARARVIGPEGGAWGGGASGNAREGAAGVDVLVVSSSPYKLFFFESLPIQIPLPTKCLARRDRKVRNHFLETLQ